MQNKSPYEILWYLENPENKLSSPFDYSSYKGDYFDFVHNKIEEYIRLLKTVDATGLKDLNSCLNGLLPPGKSLARPLDILKDALAVQAMVKSVIGTFYKGLFSQAFKILEDFFLADDARNAELLPQLEACGKEYFRMRTGHIQEMAGQGEMFHIAFDERRYKAKSERYSPAGYPCLYLSGSLQTSWRELGSPQGDITYVKCRFKNDSAVASFIDIGFPDSPKPYLWDLYSLFMYYPLFIACSVNVKNEDAEYSPEYILPQMMLEFTRYHSRYGVGISFLSTKNTDDSVYSWSRHNFVIPSKGADAASGYDVELAGKMQMTGFISGTGADLQKLYDKYGGLFSLQQNSMVPEMKFNDIILK